MKNENKIDLFINNPQDTAFVGRLGAEAIAALFAII